MNLKLRQYWEIKNSFLINDIDVVLIFTYNSI